MGVGYYKLTGITGSDIDDLDTRLSREIKQSHSTCMKQINQEVSSLKIKQNLFSKD